MLNFTFMRKISKKHIYATFYQYMIKITDLCSFSKKKNDLGPKDYRSMQKRNHFADLCAKDLKITDACPIFTDICSIIKTIC